MVKKVFISHASEDKELVSLFVDKILHNGSGVEYDDIFYTSREDTGVSNGEDIPDSIKKELLNSNIFLMMVSENYRKSEVCLNEMGAAWVLNGLTRIIMVLPDTGFDKIGWLISLKKGTKVIDPDGLDHIHDEISRILGLSVKTVTWNRNKSDFLAELCSYIKNEERVVAPIVEAEMDLLDIREYFDTNVEAYIDILKSITAATEEYNDHISLLSKRLNQLQSNPGALSPRQVRAVMQKGAMDTNSLSEIYECQEPKLHEHFDLSVKYAIMLQSSDMDESIKKENRDSFSALMDSIISTKDGLVVFRKSLDDIASLDKTFDKANNRLKKALDKMLEVVSFCISRAADYLAQ